MEPLFKETKRTLKNMRCIKADATGKKLIWNFKKKKWSNWDVNSIGGKAVISSLLATIISKVAKVGYFCNHRLSVEMLRQFIPETLIQEFFTEKELCGIILDQQKRLHSNLNTALKSAIIPRLKSLPEYPTEVWNSKESKEEKSKRYSFFVSAADDSFSLTRFYAPLAESIDLTAILQDKDLRVFAVESLAKAADIHYQLGLDQGVFGLKLARQRNKLWITAWEDHERPDPAIIPVNPDFGSGQRQKLVRYREALPIGTSAELKDIFTSAKIPEDETEEGSTDRNLANYWSTFPNVLEATAVPVPKISRKRKRKRESELTPKELEKRIHRGKERSKPTEGQLFL